MALKILLFILIFVIIRNFIIKIFSHKIIKEIKLQYEREEVQK
jgi:hypothetical protein